MKKFLSLILLICSLLFIVACGNNVEITDIQETKFIEADNKYEVVDSFKVDDGNCYYFYYLGTVDYVPLNLHDSSGIYFNGAEPELKFKLTTTDVEKSEENIKTTFEDSVSLKNSTYYKGSVSSSIIPFIEAKMEAGIILDATSSIKSTLSQSLTKSVSQQHTFEQELTYKMSKKDPSGYYFYTPVASIKFYEVIVYNPETKEIEYMTTYNEVGKALPGLFYSPTSTLDYFDFDIEFDEEKLPEFTTPKRNVNTKITLNLDANGGSCTQATWKGEIGSKYTGLPTPELDKYEFLGWSANGQIVDENSQVMSDANLVAQWKILTKKDYSVNKKFEFSKISKLNPLFLLTNSHDGDVEGQQVNLSRDFDLQALAQEGYKLKITATYNAKFADPFWADRAHYKIQFKSGSSGICTLSDYVTSDSYVSKTNISNLIELSKLNGSFSFIISTENINEITIKDMVISLEFIK